MQISQGPPLRPRREFHDLYIPVSQVFEKLKAKGILSRPKPDTRICDHDQHVNIKPKPGINKNQLFNIHTFT